MRSVGMMVLGALVSGAGASALEAQTLQEVCPGAEEGTGVLYGLVSDEGGEMGMPGATVTVTWQVDGDAARAEGETAFDGGYTICYVPLGVELEVRPVFANLPGAGVVITLSEEITRQDLSFALEGAGADEDDDRIWACPGGSDDNTIVMQNSRLIRCDPNWQVLERCPKAEELGRVQATMTGAGVGMFREAIEKLVTDARRLGANALVNWQIQRGRSIDAEAVVIEVDPSTCT